MRETLFRERRERVSHVEVFAKMIARVYNVDEEKAFGGIIAGYEAEVFQETYDAEALKRKIAVIREAQKRVKAKRLHEESLLSRLDKMGEYYDQKYGKELKGAAQAKTTKPSK